MIKIEKTEVMGWEHAIRGMRNPKNSWDESDSIKESECECPDDECSNRGNGFCVGTKDHNLMQTLADAGTDHGKYLRMIVVYADVTAPLYWWKEADTYRMGVEKNSCSTMHKLTYKPFELDDFSHDKMSKVVNSTLGCVVETLNALRSIYQCARTDEDKKQAWYDMIQLLPSSYNQRRTCMMSYAALKNIYHARKNHKLDEWREFCKWIESLPYSELITGKKK